MTITQIKCPDNTFTKCNKDMENIIGKRGLNNGLHGLENLMTTDKCAVRFKQYGEKGTTIDSNSCEKQYGGDDCNNCDYLFENLIRGETTCKELYDNIRAMSKDEIDNQIKYNLNQLVQMRLKVNAIQNMPAFGTYEWWMLNIWGTNKMQNYIYILSFVICVIIIINFLWIFISMNNRAPLLIIWAFVIAIIIIVLLFYYTFRSQINYSIPISSEFDNRFIETDPNRYNKDVRDRIVGKTADGNLRYDPISSFAGFLSLAVVLLLVVAYFIKSSFFKNMVLYILFGLIIAINVFYIFLIPQLLIIGIILQYIIIYLFSSSTINPITRWIIGILIVFFTTTFGLFGIIADRNTQAMKNECNENMSPNSSLGFQYFFIFIAIIIVIISKYIYTYTSITKSKTSSIITEIPVALFHPFFELMEEVLSV